MEVNILGRCDVCGKELKESYLNHIVDKFSFPCTCHSPVHCISRYLCNDCISNFREDPKKICKVTVSIDTFVIFLKSYSKFRFKYLSKSLSISDLNPIYDFMSSSPDVTINCTYETLVFLGQLYTEWTYYYSHF